AALVLIDDPDRGAQADQDNQNDDAKDDQREYAHGSLLANALVDGFHLTGHQRAPAWKSARVMTMRPAALRTAQLAVGAGPRPEVEVGRPRRCAPASRPRAARCLRWPATARHRRTPSHWDSAVLARCPACQSSTPHPRRRDGAAHRSACAG